MAKRDFYDVLGAVKGASADELKKAYRKAALEHHPDRAKDATAKKTAEAKFKEVNEAYDVLKDPQKKAAYDQYGHAAFDQSAGAAGFGGSAQGNPFGGQSSGSSFDFGGQAGFNTDDIFNMFFGGQGGRRAQASNGGRDLHYEVSISFDKAVHGGEERVQLSHLAACKTCSGSGAAKGSKPISCDRCGGSGEIQQQASSVFGQFTTVATCPKCQGEGKIITTPCPTCGGKGRVNDTEELVIQVPAGVDSGTELRFAARGDAGARGGRPGDLYLEFRVLPHPYFQRKGNSIYLKLPLSLADAALGVTMEVPTVDGTTMVKIPSGVTKGAEVRLAGKGVSKLGGGGKGDQLLVVDVVTPQRLSGEEKKLLDQLAKVEQKPKMPWAS